jgi:uncharacterized protein YjbJ (UPF0337 family)
MRRPLAAIANFGVVMGINKDQVEGRAKEARGKVQKKFGELTGNKTQQAKGLAKEVVGAGQAKAGDLAEEIKDASKKP